MTFETRSLILLFSINTHQFQVFCHLSELTRFEVCESQMIFFDYSESLADFVSF